LTADLQAATSNTGIAAGDSYLSIENLYGTNFADSLRGNAGTNAIWSGNGNDILNGRGGNDHLVAGNGNDLLLGGAGGDVLDGAAGTDGAQYNDAPAGLIADLQVATSNTGIAAGDSYISIENLYGTNFADSLRGNAGANAIWGGNGNDILNGRGGDDRLIGGPGNDKLTGGIGKDVFQFDAPLSASTNVDLVLDFNNFDDKIWIDNADFKTAGALGTLARGAFFIGAAAHDSSDRIIYNSATGALRYDLDGTGASASIQFATLSSGLALSNVQFTIV
jgi:serralysin